MQKIKVGVLFGGCSTEHEISIISAMNIMKNLDRNKYSLLPIGIDKKEKFHLGIEKIKNNLIIDDSNLMTAINGLELCSFPDCINDKLSEYIDVAFPILHGYLGEDGAIQGLLKIFNIPFVGCDIMSSSVCMDKDITKRILKSVNIPVTRSITIYKSNANISYENVSSSLGKTLFVKSANSGSSVGVYRARNKQEFDDAIKDAFKYDNKLIIEEAIDGQELECSVIGNESPQVSNICGEIIVKDKFYSYEAKYLDDTAAKLQIPANIDLNVTEQIKSLAIKAYKIIGCEGMARIDFLLTKDKQPILNEINTIPGFTNISMYPMLLQHSGFNYSQIIDNLITLALEKYKKDRALLKSR